MTDKDRRGINNFKTNTRAREPYNEFLESIKREKKTKTRGQIKPYARGKIIWYLWNHKTLHL